MAVQRKPAKKATAKKTAVSRKPGWQPLEDEFVPLELTRHKVEDEDRMVAFVIDGVEYTIPKKVPKGVGLRILRKANEIGFEMALAEGMQRFYGKEAMEALEDAELSDEQWDQLQEVFRKIVFGDDEESGKAS